MQLSKTVCGQKKAGAWYHKTGISLGIGNIGSLIDAVADVSDMNGKLTVNVYEQAAKAHGAEVNIETGTGADIQKMMTLSTAHISSKTGEYLDGNSSLVVYPKNEYGWFVFTGYSPEEMEEIPDDLKACIMYSSEHGCDWLCLDGDGPEIKDLPVYRTGSENSKTAGLRLRRTMKRRKKMYQIKITYTWGDEEEPIGRYETKEEAYQEALMMAAKEAYVQNEEFVEGRDAVISANATEYLVSLLYGCDGETCYYNIIEAEPEEKREEETGKTYHVTAFPYATIEGDIVIPDGASDVREYIEEHFNDIRFGEASLDYKGTEMDICGEDGDAV